MRRGAESVDAPVVPTLQTERLRLRGHRLDDFGPCAAMWADPTVTRHIGGKPVPRRSLGPGCCVTLATGRCLVLDTGWLRNRRQAALPARSDSPITNGTWLCRSKTTPKPVGCSSPNRTVKAMPPRPLALSSHGVTSTSDQPQLTASLLLNIPSVRVAEKCGYRELQITTYKGHTAKVFVR